MVASCAVALKLCSKEPLRFYKIVSEMARQRDTHPDTSLPSFLELATQTRARIKNVAFIMRQEVDGEREEFLLIKQFTENLRSKAPS